MEAPAESEAGLEPKVGAGAAGEVEDAVPNLKLDPGLDFVSAAGAADPPNLKPALKIETNSVRSG